MLKIFFLENLARIKKEPLKKVWEEYDDDQIYWEELERVAKKYKQFKKYRSLLDFTDLLEKLSEDKFRKLCKGSAVKRTKYSGLKRNITYNIP